MQSRRVVVTGIGAMTPVGKSAPDFWQGLVSGKSGAGPITKFDAANHKVRFACEVKAYNSEDYFERKESRRYELFVQFSIIASREAVKDSGLDLAKLDLDRFGVYMGSGIGGLDVVEEQAQVLHSKGPDRVSPMLIPRLIPNMAAGQTSISLGLRGPNSCPVTACASGLHAIGDAMMAIRRGQADFMIAGGTEAAITPLGIAGFANMKALSERNDSPETASRPFSADRDGFVMGEGAGALLLEEYEHAKARGATIYAELAGYGATGDAHHVTAPAPEHEGAQRAMRMAMADAGVKPHEVSTVSAHGTSTPLNDKLETAAIKAVFGDHAAKVAVSAIKSSVGHLLGAAGGVSAVAAAMAIRNGMVPPTINYSSADPECDLDYVTSGARTMGVNAALVNAFGFGGHNACILLKKI